MFKFRKTRKPIFPDHPCELCHVIIPSFCPAQIAYAWRVCPNCCGLSNAKKTILASSPKCKTCKNYALCLTRSTVEHKYDGIYDDTEEKDEDRTA